MMDSETKKLLYIDDEIYSQDVVRRILSRYYNVDLCGNAVLALEKVKTVQYDVILIDINLGYGMNGIQLFELIRAEKNYINIPVIALTAYASHSDKKEFLLKGFTEYLAKPFLLQELVDIVKKVLDKK
jgi:CheY-like chemotaxis protein